MFFSEPPVKRAVAFFDGQNLFHHAKAAFGHHHPNYDPLKLTNAICDHHGWSNYGVRFYTGIPLASKSEMWSRYWSARLLAMSRAGIHVTKRSLKYQRTETILPDGSVETVEIPQEKGIDVRLALDVMRLTVTGQLDVAIIFSQDQDLAELGQDLREIARTQNRWIKAVSAFPTSPTASASRGLDKMDWFRMHQTFYDACLDPRDYRPKT
jgi:uncharacterized LabA/DUF88 family protein